MQQLTSLPISIPRPEEVWTYLDRFPDLVDLVHLACLKARAEFSAEAELSLELYRDRETEDHYLTLYVRQAVYDRQVMARIEKVRAHYRDELSSRSGWFHVTTDFSPPGSAHGV